MNEKTISTDTEETLGYAREIGKQKFSFSNWVKDLFRKKTKEGDDPRQLVEYEQVKGTPFTAVKDGNKWYVLMGKYRLTEAMETKAEAVKDAEEITYFRIMQIFNIMMQDYQDQKKIQKNGTAKNN
jgi:hypothetical protein